MLFLHGWLSCNSLPFYTLVLINHFIGSIPSALGNLTHLTLLDLSFNDLKGETPIELCLTRGLSHLHLGMNQLTGSIPNCIGNLSKLSFLGLHSNSLSGSVPATLGIIQTLNSVRLQGNGILTSCHLFPTLCDSSTFTYIVVLSPDESLKLYGTCLHNYLTFW